MEKLIFVPLTTPCKCHIVIFLLMTLHHVPMGYSVLIQCVFCVLYSGAGGACDKGKPFPLISTCPHDPVAFTGLYLTSVGKH